MNGRLKEMDSELRGSVSLLLSMLLLLGLVGNIAPQVETLSSPDGRNVESAAYVDLNALMFDEFQKWDAMITRYISINGSLMEHYDYSRAPDYSKLTLASSAVCFDALVSFYEATNGEYYLSKLRAMIDAFIEGSGPDGFYTFDSYKGEIFYVWTYRYDVPPVMEAEFTALYVMAAGASAVWLYQETGELKYRNLADRIARESLNLAIVNNSTDMAWYYRYVFNATEADCIFGHHELGCFAQFYSVYGRYINSTYASYVPKIIHWIWRAQLASGGLGYKYIGDTVESRYYTAFVLWPALEAYKNVPEQFSESLKTKLNNTITYLLKLSGSQYSAQNYYYAADLVLAAKSGLISSPTPDYLSKTKTYVYGSLKLARYAEKGFDVALNDCSIGYRFQGHSVGALFSTYPLPDSLKTFSSPKISFEEYQTGRYYWQGWAISNPYSIWVGDNYGLTGWAPSPYQVFVSKKTGVTARSVTELGYYFKTWTNYTDTKVLTYFYPTTTIFANVTGPSRILILSSFPADARLRVENGTIYNLGVMENGTKVFSNNFLLWRNATSMTPRQTMKSRSAIFVYCPKTKTYNFTRYADRIILTSDVSNYNITMSYLGNWAKISSPEDAFSLMQNITNTYHSLTPLKLIDILSHYKSLVDSKSPLAPWWNTYKNSVSTDVKLIAHSNPEKVSLTNWEFANQTLTFHISAPSGTASTTKVYCDGKGEPAAVYATNGTLSWSYNIATKILTLNLVHFGPPAEIVVNWKVADLNALMFDEFQKWDAMITRYISINGSLMEHYDYSRAPDYSKPTLASSAVYCQALISFYEATNGEYYLSKLRAMIDAFIEGSGPDGFYTFDSYKGEIFYLWGYRYDVPPVMEGDFSALYVMAAGASAVWLYQKTGELKYRNLADRIARESLNLAIVNNATDMAWKGNYCFNGTETDCRGAVNRQCSIAYFYSVYAKNINSTYASYVPKIVHWAWRAQLASGGLSYDIGQTSESRPYTAYALWYTLNAYSNVPGQFSESLKTKLNNTIIYLLELSGAQYYLQNHIISSALVLAVKSGFISSPTSDYLEKTKTYVYGSLMLARYAEKGFDVALDDYSTGYRWQTLHVGALFSTYPLPDSLKTFSSPKISFEEYQTGRYYWQGWAISNPYSIYVGDNYGLTGWAPYPYTINVCYKTGVTARSVTELGYYFKTWTNYTDTKVLTYFYPTTTIFANVTGPSRILILSSFPADARLRVENGTIYNLGVMENGTKVFSNNFLLWRNATSMKYRRTIFVHCPKTKTYNFTRYADRIILTSDVSNYNITVSYLGSWAKISSPEDAFSLMQNITNTYHSLTPLKLMDILSHYKSLVDSRSALASWWDTYKNSVSTDVKLIAHSNPEKVSLTSWDYANQRLTFTISAPSGTTSTTKVYCGDKGEPREVYATNGTLSWSYNASTTILTLNVVHNGPANILVDWRILGDVNGDDKVDYSDLFDLSKNYASNSSKPSWNPDCDFNWDSKVDASDLFDLSKNYGKTKT